MCLCVCPTYVYMFVFVYLNVCTYEYMCLYVSCLCLYLGLCFCMCLVVQVGLGPRTARTCWPHRLRAWQAQGRCLRLRSCPETAPRSDTGAPGCYSKASFWPLLTMTTRYGCSALLSRGPLCRGPLGAGNQPFLHRKDLQVILPVREMLECPSPRTNIWVLK